MSATFQGRAQIWQEKVFGGEFLYDTEEWNHRFGEEALETLQACGWSFEQVVQMAIYVFGRPVGQIKQEIGGAMVSLAGLATSHGVQMHDCAEVELARISTPEMMEKVKTKRSGKPRMVPFAATVAEAKEKRLIPIDFISDVNFSVSHSEHHGRPVIHGRHPGTQHRAKRDVPSIHDRQTQNDLQVEIIAELWEHFKEETAHG